MKTNKKPALIIGTSLIILFFLSTCFILPMVNKISNDLKAYETRIAYRDNYKLHTTPLDKDVIEDVCLQLKIQALSEQCKPKAVVYAPDFFDDIKIYFNNLANQDKTYSVVQKHLGAYLILCEDPDPDGFYRCKYDLRGDGVYPIFFLYNKSSLYYEIIASTGGS